MEIIYIPDPTLDNEIKPLVSEALYQEPCRTQRAIFQKAGTIQTLSILSFSAKFTSKLYSI
jgi:hypothetical protein